jgi:IS30 family transposase
MEQLNSTIMTEEKHYKHLSRSDRDTLEALFRSGTTSRVELARILEVHPSTISRELKRGAVINLKSTLEKYQTYSAEVAQQHKNVACAEKGPRTTISSSIADAIVSLMSLEKRSPSDALATLKDKGVTGLPCVKTVYNAIHHGDLAITIGDLPYRKMSRKPKRYPQQRKAYTARKNTSIEKRPAEVETRILVGHHEIDLVVGGVGSYYCLLTLVERKTRMLYIERLSGHTQKEVLRAVKKIRKEMEEGDIKSITCDNGPEFLDETAMRKATDADIYYAHPYSSYERGSNENTNRIIRRYIPKGTDIGNFTRAQIKAIQDHINSIHRDALGGLTAQQAHENEKNNQAA